MCRYRIGEFAQLTGVSVRTLHHYDRIGLFKPSGRTIAGYRWYSESDTLRLQQVLTLRYLGFPLARIADLIDAPDFDLLVSLRIQRSVVHDRMAELVRIDRALEVLLQRRQETGEWDWTLAAGASAVVQAGLTAKGDIMNEYYTPEQVTEQFEELGREMPVDEQQRITEEWGILLADVRNNRDLDPASVTAQDILERWDALVHATFRGRDRLAASVAESYRQGQYADRTDTPTPEDFAFVQRVRQARDDSVE
jgi:DNA-binding transcriptional MerR regulator